MVSQERARRVGNRIREELADILQREVSDPRLVMITVTGVDVDRELAFATVYVTCVDADRRIEEILEALEGAKGFLRRELAARIQLRTFPKLRFRWDDSPDRGARIDSLLDSLGLVSRDPEGDTRAD